MAFYFELFYICRVRTHPQYTTDLRPIEDKPIKHIVLRREFIQHQQQSGEIGPPAVDNWHVITIDKDDKNYPTLKEVHESLYPYYDCISIIKAEDWQKFKREERAALSEGDPYPFSLDRFIPKKIKYISY